MKIKFLIFALIIIIVGVCLLVFLLGSKQGANTPDQTPVPFTNITPQTVPTPITTAQSSPTGTVKEFYSWYLAGIQQNVNFETTPEFTSRASTWLSQSYIDQLPVIVEKTGLSPFLLAQDYLPSWPTNINPALVSQSANASTVQLTLGAGTEARALTVLLVKGTDGAWRISAIVPPNP